MADKTGIEWTDATWNPTTGCDRVSPGCDHCYALTLAKRLKAMGSSRYQTDGAPATSGPGFGFTEHPAALDQPIRWTRPRRIFVNSMSDLFHENASRDHVADVFAVMGLARHHTFQVLTKRPAKMRSWLGSLGFEVRMRDRAYLMTTGEHPAGIRVPAELVDAYADISARPWPLPNVWLGTSVEDQKRAHLRIPSLLATPAAVRFLSMEPLLGPVDLTEWIDDERAALDQRGDIDWVIAGGESGPGARPMHPEWVRSIRDQTRGHGVAFHFKQWGEWAPVGTDDLAGGRHDGWMHADGRPAYYAARHRPGVAHVARIGKKTTGRELDGRTWDEFPA